AYGMSALFILEALSSIGQTGHLTTIEGLDLQFSLSSEMLNNRYGESVSCNLGMTQDILPKLVKSMDKIDFMFHDAAHKKENYISDFTNALPVLKPGSVIVFDDIRWNAGLFSAKNTRCYEGWKEIIANPQVVWAVEINNSVGLALLA
ncbi:MAG: class I SAM-dependent methyltransferase, partial [Cyanobacteria bacterium J06558_2]